MLVIISRTNGFISLNFGTMHLRVEEINVQWNEGSFRPNLVQSINPLTKVIKVCPNDRLNYFTLEDNSKIVRIQWKIRWQFKAILLQKHRVNFNKTKRKTSLFAFEQTSPKKLGFFSFFSFFDYVIYLDKIEYRKNIHKWFMFKTHLQCKKVVWTAPLRKKAHWPPFYFWF